jgi:sarcosine oxidase subunit gamma
MADLALRSPPTVAPADWLRVLPPASRWVLHGDASARALAAPAWGAGFAETACRAVRVGSRATLWLGPDEYLLLDLGAPADGTDDAKVAPQAALESALVGVPHALVDVSHRQFALEVSGPHASTLLSAACPLDLDAREFPVGMCTRTVFAKADLVLWRTGPDAFHMEIWRSFADYVGGLLHEIAREFHPA